MDVAMLGHPDHWIRRDAATLPRLNSVVKIKMPGHPIDVQSFCCVPAISCRIAENISGDWAALQGDLGRLFWSLK
jgi:hypothetical protein